MVFACAPDTELDELIVSDSKAQDDLTTHKISDRETATTGYAAKGWMDGKDAERKSQAGSAVRCIA